MHTKYQTAPSDQLTRMLGYISADPDNQSLTLRTIDLCIDESQLHIASDLLSTAKNKWPNQIGIINRLAIVALRNTQPEDAIALLETIYSNEVPDAAVSYNLAYANYHTGNFRRAREVIEPILAHVGEVPAIAPLYILCLQQIGDIDTAMTYGKTRLAITPEDAELRGVLALLYFDCKDIPLARQCTQLALSKRPDHPMALVTASYLAMLDEAPAEAELLARKVLDRNSRDGRAWSSLGLALMYQMKLIDAQAALETSVKYMQNHIGTWHALAWIYLMQDRIEPAETCFNQALSIDRTFGETHGGLAIVNYLKGNTQQAQSQVERARRLSPNGMTIHYIQLAQLLEAGNGDLAKEYIVKALSNNHSISGDPLSNVIMRMTKTAG